MEFSVGPEDIEESLDDADAYIYSSVAERVGLSTSDMSILDELQDLLPEEMFAVLFSDDTDAYYSALDRLSGSVSIDREELVRIIGSIRSVTVSSPSPALSASFVVDGMVFSVTDPAAGAVSLIGYDGSSDSISLPGLVEYGSRSYRLTSISPCSLSGLDNLVSVSIPDTVTSIGYRAFSGCSRLITVSISSSVRSIAFRAFEGCRSLENYIVNPSNPCYFTDSLGILCRRDPVEIVRAPVSISGEVHLSD